MARASRRGGLVDESEPLRQQAQLAQARAHLPGLLARQAQAASRLTQLCGERPGALQAELARDGTVSDEAALPDLSLGLPAELVRRRPDIAAAEARLHAATADIGIAVADLACPWESLALSGREPPSWVLARRLMTNGVAGVLVPSFAPGAGPDATNAVFWRWTDDRPHQVKVVDDHGRLPRDDSSWP